MSDAEIIDNVRDASADDTCTDVDADATAADEELCEPPTKVSEAINGLETVLRWLETHEVDYVKVLHMRNLLDFAKSKRETGRKQLKSKRKAMNRNWCNQKANPALNTKAGNK